MATQAAEHVTPINCETEDLTSVHRYLVESGYEIEPALRTMEQHIATPEFPLTVEEYVDGELRNAYNVTDRFYFRTKYKLKFDLYDQEVRVVPRIWRLMWGGLAFVERRYRVVKQTVRLVWPAYPPASHAPNQQPEDMAAPDPFRTGAAGRPSAAHFVLAEAERRIAEKEVTPTLGGLNAFSEDLKNWWDVERLTFNPPGPPMEAGSIKNVVRELWNAALGVQN
jgi:hypothetical protein